jgi:serine-type D-Ala-D-Ala carboxypeptidase/endopeptidase (penicillin-binding protein 4)
LLEHLDFGGGRPHSCSMRRTVVALAGALAAVLLTNSPASGRPAWKSRIDGIAAKSPMGIAVQIDGRMVYRHGARRSRIPASNQKLLTTMALLDRLGTDRRIPTTLAAARVGGGVVGSNLWVLGRGDPTIGSAGGSELPIRDTLVRRLADKLRSRGITRITGRVMGSTGYFRRDWWAPGWKRDFPRLYVARPTALTFEQNSIGSRNIRNPEVRLAQALTRRLERTGIAVRGRPGAGRPPGGLSRVARVQSAPLISLVHYMNHQSSNFFAEVLGKHLARASRAPGSIAAAARVIESWARRRGAGIEAFDASGLSYRNRVSAWSLVKLLAASVREPWGKALRTSLPPAGRGTLKDRLAGVRVRAKTGTLDGVSALSGWVWVPGRSTWAEFSILSSGTSKDVAVGREDRIVRILRRRAH